MRRKIPKIDTVVSIVGWREEHNSPMRLEQIRVYFQSYHSLFIDIRDYPVRCRIIIAREIVEVTGLFRS